MMVMLCASVEGKGGLRPLHLAAKADHDLLCKALLMAGAEPDATQEIQGQHYSALHHAAAKGNVAATRELMRFGADPHEGEGVGFAIYI
jgi:ankyrin repeat protein